jgi:hypothetical protein
MSGTGPDAIRGKTYFEIQMEQAELDGSIRQRKPGLDAVPVLKTGRGPAHSGVHVEYRRPRSGAAGGRGR